VRAAAAARSSRLVNTSSVFISSPLLGGEKWFFTAIKDYQHRDDVKNGAQRWKHPIHTPALSLKSALSLKREGAAYQRFPLPFKGRVRVGMGVVEPKGNLS